MLCLNKYITGTFREIIQQTFRKRYWNIPAKCPDKEELNQKSNCRLLKKKRRGKSEAVHASFKLIYGIITCGQFLQTHAGFHNTATHPSSQTFITFSLPWNFECTRCYVFSLIATRMLLLGLLQYVHRSRKILGVSALVSIMSN